MKFVNILRSIIITISLFFSISSLWLIIFKQFYKEPIMFFLLIFGVDLLLSVYRFDKMLKDNDGVMSKTQVQYCLLGFCKAVFFCLTYLGVRTCIHKRLNRVWKWEILIIDSAEETENFKGVSKLKIRDKINKKSGVF